MSDPGPEVTQLLAALNAGEEDAEERVWNLLYDELRRLARYARRPGASLETTALVHELYVRFADRSASAFESRAHFFATAAQAMRQILVDRARRKRAAKRDGGQRVEADEMLAAAGHPAEEVLAVHAALADLARTHPRHARLVELRFFAGLTLEEAAAGLGVSRATAARDWQAARAWLYSELAPRDPAAGGEG